MKTQFPLYFNDGKPVTRLSKFQKQTLDTLKAAIKTGKLKMVENKCLCNNAYKQKDIVVSEKDRYGLPVQQILCSKCGIIRSGQVFDDISNTRFYQFYYRNLYVGDINNEMEIFFRDQFQRGNKFLNLIKKYIPVEEFKDVTEIGCGAGGILMPFKDLGKNVTGYDFDTNYLEYGRMKGLNLIYGGSDQMQNNSTDLIILSHVMEHFLHPLEEMKSIIEKIKPEKYLLVEVPGLFRIADIYLWPIRYFQNAHVYNYYYYYLRVFFTQIGLDVLYGDERCTFICRKPKDWSVQRNEQVIYDNSL